MKLLIIFGIVAYVAGVPLDDNCEWGESYWCSDLKVAKKCGALEHCTSTVWSKQILAQDGTEECIFCEAIVTEVRQMMNDKQTVDQIQKMLLSVCDVIPSKTMAAKCKSVVDNDLPDLLSTISAHLDPQMVCGLLGLCTGLEDKVHHTASLPGKVEPTGPYCALAKVYGVEANDSKVCTDCKTLIKDIRDSLTSETTEKQVEKFLDDYLCSSLGPLADMCTSEVASIVPMVMSMLQAQLDPDVICQVLCLCQSTTRSRVLFATLRLQSSPLYKMTRDMDTSSECYICKTVFKELQTLDRDAATQKKVIAFIKTKVCSHLGSMEAVCIISVDTYAKDIFELLVNELDPKIRCRALGFCSNESSNDVTDYLTVLTRLATPEAPVNVVKPVEAAVKPVKVSATCLMCEFVIREIDSMLASNSTEEEIIQALDKVCDLMPDTIKAECRQFVSKYGKAIVAMLEQQLDPKAICTSLGLCRSLATTIKAYKPLKKDEYCGICEVVIQYLDSLLENNATVAEIEKAVEKICNFLPKAYAQQCDDFIEKYGAGIIILLESVADPKVICQELGLCSNATQKKVMKTVKMMELEPAVYAKEPVITKETAPLLGKNKCTWGPSYWCSNVDNAKACNAMEHCKNYVWKN